MKHPLIAVDVGNSRIKVGLFDPLSYRREEGELPKCLHATATPVGEPLPWDDVCKWLDANRDVNLAGAVAGANPAGVKKVLDSWPDRLGQPPRVIESPAGFRLRVDVDAPSKVGVDRLLNAVATNVIRPHNRPAIIVSSGTATTVDYVTTEGAFAGGAILPGFELSALSLHRYTALLPLISIEELAAQPHLAIGQNTPAAMRSGLFWGQLGAVKELIMRLENATHEQPAFLVLTGGGAPLLAPHLGGAPWEPHLALQGLAIAAIESAE